MDLISRKRMGFMERLEDQKEERKKCLAFNAILGRAVENGKVF